METVKKLGWAPDIIHCQGWMTSLIPLYLKTIYKNEPVFRNAKVIYSLHNEGDNFQNLGADFARKASLNTIEQEQMGSFNDADLTGLHIGAVTHADAVVTLEDKVDLTLGDHLNSKPTMRHTDEGFEEQYVTFYEQLMSQVN
jgi:starch synthase